MLISRKLAQWVCGLGMVQLFFATALTVCGFIVLGLFQNVNGTGIWIGLPALAPGLLSVITLGTRHTSASGMVFFTSLAILGIGAWHSSTVYSEVEFWGKYRVYAESSPLNPICSVKQQAVDDGQMNSFHCLCDDVGDYNAAGYTVRFCDEYRVGEDLFWTMFVMSVALCVFSLLNGVLSLVACFVCRPKDLDGYDKSIPAQDQGGARHNYAVTR